MIKRSKEMTMSMTTVSEHSVATDQEDLEKKPERKRRARFGGNYIGRSTQSMTSGHSV